MLSRRDTMKSAAVAATTGLAAVQGEQTVGGVRRENVPRGALVSVYTPLMWWRPPKAEPGAAGYYRHSILCLAPVGYNLVTNTHGATEMVLKRNTAESRSLYGRWQKGSQLAGSVLHGLGWDSSLPRRFSDLLIELRRDGDGGPLERFYLEDVSVNYVDGELIFVASRLRNEDDETGATKC